jgi:hypothetical protein
MVKATSTGGSAVTTTAFNVSEDGLYCILQFLCGADLAGASQVSRLWYSTAMRLLGPLGLTGVFESIPRVLCLPQQPLGYGLTMKNMEVVSPCRAHTYDQVVKSVEVAKSNMLHMEYPVRVEFLQLISEIYQNFVNLIDNGQIIHYVNNMSVVSLDSHAIGPRLPMFVRILINCMRALACIIPTDREAINSELSTHEENWSSVTVYGYKNILQDWLVTILERKASEDDTNLIKLRIINFIVIVCQAYRMYPDGSPFIARIEAIRVIITTKLGANDITNIGPQLVKRVTVRGVNCHV